MSAEAWAEEQFAAAVGQPDFRQRLLDAGLNLGASPVVVASSTPVGEALVRADGGRVLLVVAADEGEFELAWVEVT